MLTQDTVHARHIIALLVSGARAIATCIPRSRTRETPRILQASPFGGLLTPEERQSILNDYESRRASHCFGGGAPGRTNRNVRYSM
jgi:hypothetical protein